MLNPEQHTQEHKTLELENPRREKINVERMMMMMKKNKTPYSLKRRHNINPNTYDKRLLRFGEWPMKNVNAFEISRIKSFGYDKFHKFTQR